LGFTYKKEGNACDKCGKFNTDVGPMTHYQKHGYNDLLCKNCIAKIEEQVNKKCPVCNKVVGLDAMTEYEGKRMCQICAKEAMGKKIKSKVWKNWVRENILKLIGIGIGAITAVIAYLAYLILNN